jgi:phospholipid/cholesterol/gamma-HCH transport system substrate-binding protein
MDRDRRLSLVVGAFVVGILGVLAAAILSLSAERGIWTSRYRLVTYFTNVQGLIEGAPVRLAGKDVGSVEFISFAALGEERPPVRVVLLVDEGVQHRIRSDSVATIGTIGLLGDKYVEISMGSPQGEVLPDGAELASVSPLDLNEVVTRGTAVMDGITRLTENVNGVVEDFGRNMGGRGLAETVSTISDVAKQVQQGEGLLHSIIYDSYEGGGVESIERALATFEEILDEVAHGQGALHTLIYEPADEQELLVEARDAGSRLNSILQKIDRGDGTLGLLVNDPTLYEDLKLLLGGAQRSLLVRSLLRLSAEDGAQ